MKDAKRHPLDWGQKKAGTGMLLQDIGELKGRTITRNKEEVSSC